MNITAKTRYGIVALLDIAFHQDAGPVQRRQLSKRQAIPTDYMDQILLRLRSAGLVQSLRGREGGYQLSLHPSEISLWDISMAVEDEPYGGSLKSSQDAEHYGRGILTGPAWESVENSLKDMLSKTNLETLLEDAHSRVQQAGLDPICLMESEVVYSRA